MNWCVTVEITGEPARVIGPFRSEEAAGDALDMVEAELKKRGIDEEVAPSVQLMIRGTDWEQGIPWT